jgi:hypothetical protein
MTFQKIRLDILIFCRIKPGLHLYQISVSVSRSACENRVLYQARVSEMINDRIGAVPTRSRSFAVTSKGRHVIQIWTVWTGAESRYDRRSAGQSVLVSSPIWGS